MIRNIITITTALLLLFTISCSKKNTDVIQTPKGYFEPFNYLDTDDNFATPSEIRPNQLKKITEGPSSYYSWKTIKTDIKIDSDFDEYYSAYKTILNSDFEQMNIEGKKYLRTADKILNNYLFFLDDCRVLYLSEDDNRFELTWGELNMMYMETVDCIKPNDQKIYKNANRGYYTINGNTIEINFKSGKDFYVKATISDYNNRITFDEISIDTEKKEIDLGLKNRYEDFETIFSDIAQPIFEVPNTDDFVNEPQFHLNFGVMHCKAGTPALAKFRNKIIDKVEEKQTAKYAATIDNIYYEIDHDNFTYLRHYEYRIRDLENFTSSKTLKHSEDLTDMFTW